MADDKNEDIKDAEIIEEKKSSNMLLFILLPVLLIVGLGAGVFLGPMIMGGHDKKEETSEKSSEGGGHGDSNDDSDYGSEKSSKEVIDPKLISFIEVPSLLVNLKSDRRSRPVFLKVSLTLEVHDPKAKETVEPLLPKIIDQMQLFLRDLEISDVTGTTNLQRLRRELHMRVNNVVSPAKVDDVLIKEFLIQ